ncbi:glyoxylase-like metal-dependent hydrolase (beta-lactamase superfamily II) [Brevibacterium pityocampae]
MTGNRGRAYTRTMTNWQPAEVTICATCGVEFSAPVPEVCPVCADERQFVPRSGQEWARRSELEAAGHAVTIREVEPGLHALRVVPRLGIGQTCYLARTEQGNLLFDVPPYLDAEAVAAVAELGGVAAIVASHPHMYGMQLEWSAAFDDAPVFVSRADAGWVQRRTRADAGVGAGTGAPGDTETAEAEGPAEAGAGASPLVEYDRQIEPVPGVLVRQIGGHFSGSSIAVWRSPEDGVGVFLGGDTISPVVRSGWVTFMRSFPNYLPLSGAVVRRMADAVADLDFDRMYGNFGQQLRSGGKAAVEESAQRYIAWVSGEFDHLT